MKDLKECENINFTKCDFCNEEAEYDGKTRMGPWAAMCHECLWQYGIGLGLGKGQRLINKK